MTTLRIIEKKICLDPEYLSRDYNKHLFEKVNLLAKSECSMENGYVLSVKRIVKIKDNYISNVSCELIFVVLYEAEVLKPDIDSVFNDKVCMIFNGGVFLNVRDKFKVLIPTSSLEDHSFDAATKTFVHDRNKEISIAVGDTLKVKITGMKYQKKNFSCFGEMIC